MLQFLVLLVGLSLIIQVVEGVFLMAAIDDLNAAIAAEAAVLAQVKSKVDAITPAAPVDLSGAISAVQANQAAAQASLDELNQKFPS